MSDTLIFYLVLHIILGSAGIIFLTAYLLSLSKKEPDSKSLKSSSFLAVLSFIGSWIFGGLYYTSYYGKVVKPIILKGQYSWVHTILMETKEHLFLFLPFLTIALFVITALGKKGLEKNENLKKSVLRFAFIIVGLGITAALAGYMISGAVTK